MSVDLLCMFLLILFGVALQTMWPIPQQISKKEEEEEPILVSEPSMRC